MIILVAGSDVWRVEQDITRLRGHFVEKFDTASLNVLDAEFPTAFEELLNAASALPFLSEKRLVIARSVPFEEEVSENMQLLLSRTAPSTILLLVSKESSEKLASLHKHLETVTHVPFKSHFYDQTAQLAPQDIQTAASHYGLRLSQSQIQELTLSRGSVVNRLHTLFAALKDAAESGIVEPSLWRAFIPAQEEQRAFDFVDALMEKNPVKVFALCEEMTSGEGELIPLWAMLYTQIRKYYALSRAGRHFAEVAGEMGISFFEQNKIKKALSAAGSEYIADLYGRYEQIEKEGKKAKDQVRLALFRLADASLSS